MRSCIGAVRSSGCRGLHAHRLAHHGVEVAIAWCQSAKRGLAIVAPPGRLAAGHEGAPFLAEALSSIL
jgi:hypothetical protein